MNEEIALSTANNYQTFYLTFFLMSNFEPQVHGNIKIKVLCIFNIKK